MIHAVYKITVRRKNIKNDDILEFHQQLRRDLSYRLVEKVMPEANKTTLLLKQDPLPSGNDF